MALSQRIHFCTSRDGTRIAFAVSGGGPPLVKTFQLATHLELDADDPTLGPWLATLARGRTLVRYDPRGFGLSDREVRDVSVERHLDDFTAVVEAAGLERFALIGVAGGGPVAVTYAARHPARVTHLVLHGTFLVGRLARSRTPEETAEAETLLRVVELGWGRDDPAFRQLYTSQFMPDGTAEQFRALNELMRRATSGANAARFLRELHLTDLREVAPKVRSPTLVLHVRDDRRMPFEQGRALAAAIVDSRFVPLDGRNHLLLPLEPASRQFAAELDDFLPRAAAQARPARPSMAGLTRREHEVLELVAQGLGNAAIGERVGMSEKTVRNNVSAILGKMGVHSRAEAIVKARDAGFGSKPGA
jgi:pimeloyl-ACP methyl ester carboxylesterase/DNA-binding CsgD family transcriptional regulator